MRAFAVAEDGVDPARVPTRRLVSGASIPAIGLGTFGSDRFTGEQVADAVLGAAEVGYRHFDCASVYGNERDVGRSLRAIRDGGIRREDLWVTSKLWNDEHGEGRVGPACERSLADLGLDLPGPLPRPLAIPELPSPGLRRRHAQPRRPAVSCTRTSWPPGDRWRRWSTAAWCGTSARRT